MIIEIDWHLVPESWQEQDYLVIEDYWEDGEEWAKLEIINPKLQTWISLAHNDWILTD